MVEKSINEPSSRHNLSRVTRVETPKNVKSKTPTRTAGREEENHENEPEFMQEIVADTIYGWMCSANDWYKRTFSS